MAAGRAQAADTVAETQAPARAPVLRRNDASMLATLVGSWGWLVAWRMGVGLSVSCVTAVSRVSCDCQCECHGVQAPEYEYRYLEGAT